MTTATPYRITGHESFPCRYAWLPKAVRGLAEDPELFADPDNAMVELGLGKNMVRSARFWAQAAGMIAQLPNGAGYEPSGVGSAVLGPEGRDQFLEDIRTLWLIHWKLSTNKQHPLLAWDFLLNRWQEPDLTHSAAMDALEEETARRDASVSRATLDQHLNTFLHTYVPTRGRKGEVLEDNLDCPLVELELLIKVGDRAGTAAEPVYAFRREEKSAITPELFHYCLLEFWDARHPGEKTLPFREIVNGHGSPGQIFKLPEEDLRTRADRLAQQTGGEIAYVESANLQQLQRNRRRGAAEFLTAIYDREDAHA